MTKNQEEADRKGQFLFFFFWGGDKFRRVMSEKLNPSHSFGAGPSRSQGHERPWFFRHHPTEHKHDIKNIAILLNVKGIAIINIKKFCYI